MERPPAPDLTHPAIVRAQKWGKGKHSGLTPDTDCILFIIMKPNLKSEQTNTLKRDALVESIVQLLGNIFLALKSAFRSSESTFKGCTNHHLLKRLHTKTALSKTILISQCTMAYFIVKMKVVISTLFDWRQLLNRNSLQHLNLEYLNKYKLFY